MTWALYNKETGKFISRGQETPGTLSGDLPVGLEPHLAWLVESSEENVAFDPNTQKLSYFEEITIDGADPRTGTVILKSETQDLDETELRRRQEDLKLSLVQRFASNAAKKLAADQDITQEELYDVVKYMTLRDRLTEI